MKRILTLSLLTSAALLAAAPNAGTILRQIPQAPALKQAVPLPKLEQSYPPVMAPTTSKVKVLIDTIVIQDNTVFKTKELHALVSSFEHKSLSFTDMQKIADIITKYYRSHGYFVARAYLPTQDLDKHLLIIEVIEGKYGNFTINNSSLVKTNAIGGYMPKKGKVISLSSLDRGMLLINDLSGAKIVKAEIHPGTEIGTSDFSLVVQQERRAQIYASVDNYGTKATGEYRISAGVLLNSLAGYGDSLVISTLNSFSGGIKNVGAAYTLPLGYNGLKVNLNSSLTRYNLQDSYASLNAYGKANVLDARLSYPLIRNQKRSLYIKGDFGMTFMSDTAQSQETKKHVNALTLSVSGDDVHTLFSKPAQFSGNISYIRGDVIMDNANATSNDTLINTQGYFSKVWAQITERLYLADKFSVKAQLQGQTSFSKNLDSSQKLSIGGENTLRAYTNSELSADKAVIATLEIDYKLPDMKGVAHQAGVFIDGAKAYQNANAYTSSVKNERELNDVGIAYNASYKNMNLQASFAHGFGPDAKSSIEPTNNDNKFFIALSMLL